MTYWGHERACVCRDDDFQLLPHKFAHIRRVNALLRLSVPVLLTPLELIGEVDLP